MTFLAILFALLVGHALADYPLQGDFLAKAKDRNHAFGERGVWMQALGAHALIHGGAVALVMQVSCGLWWIGLFEVACHAFVDHGKTEGRIGFHTDQALHIVCKVCWAGFAAYAVSNT